MFAIYMHTFKS